MASITLKNVPDELLEEMRRDASEERRSLNQHALYLIQVALLHKRRKIPDLTASQANAQLKAWRKLAGRWESDRSAEEEISDIYRARARSKGRKVKL